MSWDNPRFIKTPPGYNSAMSEDTEKTQSDSVEDSESKEIFDYDAYISKHPDFKNLFEDCFKSSGLPEEKRDFVKNELIKNLEEKQDFTENEFKFTVENVIDDFASEYELNQQFTDYSLILNTLIELNKLDSFQVNILLIIQNYIPTIKRSRNIKYLTEMIYGECSENLEILFDYDSCIEKIDSKLSKANSKTLAKILYGELKTNTRPDVMKTEIKNRLKSMTHSSYFLDDEIDLEEFSKERFESLFEEISDELNERIAKEIDFEALEQKYGYWNNDLKKEDNSSTCDSPESPNEPKESSDIDNDVPKDNSNESIELNDLGLEDIGNDEIKLDLELLKDENIKNNLKVVYNHLGFPDFNENITSKLKHMDLKYGSAYRIMNMLANQIAKGDFVEDEFYQEFYKLLYCETLNKKEIQIKEEKFTYHALKSKTDLSFDSSFYPNDFLDEDILYDIEYNLKSLKNFSHVQLNSLLLLKDKKPLLRRVDQIKCIFALSEIKSLHFLIQRISKNKSLDIKLLKENLKDLTPKDLAIFLNDNEETNKDNLYEKAVKAIEIDNNAKSEDPISAELDNKSRYGDDIDYNWLAIDIYDLVIKQGYIGKIKDYFKLYYKLRGNNDFEKIENEFFFDEEVHEEILNELIARYSKANINLTRIKYYLIKLSKLSIFQLNILLLILDKKITSNKEDQIKELFKSIDLDDLDNYIYIIENISLFELDLLRSKFAKYDKKELAKYIQADNIDDYTHEELLDKFLETIQKQLNSEVDVDSENKKMDFGVLSDDLYKLKIDELNESEMFVEPSVEEDDASVSDDASIDMADNYSDGEDDAVGEVDSSVDEDLSSDVAAEVEVEDSAISDDVSDVVEVVDSAISDDVSDVANVVVGGDSSVDDVKIDIEDEESIKPTSEDKSIENASDVPSEVENSIENPFENIGIDELFNYNDDFNKEIEIIKSIFADYNGQDNYKEWVKLKLNEINEFLAYPVSFEEIEKDLPDKLALDSNSSLNGSVESNQSSEDKQRNNDMFIKFAEFYKEGLLTKEEFEKKKKELL